MGSRETNIISNMKFTLKDGVCSLNIQHSTYYIKGFFYYFIL